MNWKAGILVATWFLVGVVIFAITKNWEIVAAIATWILAGGIIFAIVQVQQARKSTNAQIAVGLFRELRNEKALRMLRSIYNLRREDDITAFSQDVRDKIDYILTEVGWI